MLDPDGYSSFTVKRQVIESADRRLFVLERPDGNFCWLIERFWHEADEDDGVVIGWAGEMISGIFATPDQAEEEGLLHLRRSAPRALV